MSCLEIIDIGKRDTSLRTWLSSVNLRSKRVKGMFATTCQACWIDEVHPKLAIKEEMIAIFLDERDEHRAVARTADF